MLSNRLIRLTAEELRTIEGGEGVMIDPNGKPESGGSGDAGPYIDPNG